MGKKKSAKKRRSSVKSHAELKNLRRVSLLDSATPEPKEKAKRSQSVSPPSQPDNPPSDNGKSTRQRIDFVLPRVPGKKPKAYVFDKKRHKNRNNKITQPTIQEEDEDKGISNILRSTETIDDILFPNRRRNSSEDRPSLGAAPMKTNTSPRKAVISGGRFMLTQASDINETENARADEANLHSPKSKKDRKQRKLSDPMSPNSLGKLSGLSVEDAVKDKYGLRPRANSTDGELKLPQRGLCDERMVLESHRWNQDQNYVHQVVPKGFANLGNTCFLNATLQCLAYLPPFCQSILAISESKQRLSKQMKKKLSQGQRITSILSSLYKKIHSFDEANRGHAIAPHGIVKALPSIGTCGSRNGYKFRPGRQEDAHEFLVHLLDAMHDGELRAAGINQQASGWRDRLPVPRLDETTYIHRIFGGYFRSQVRCGSCGYCSNTYDPFLDLSLEVSKKSCRSILHSLADFTSKETLDSDNRWKCSGCSKHVRATKQLTVFRPPLSLCIQLKRFSFEGGFGARGYSAYGTRGWKYGKSNNKFGGGGKITKPIEFPGHLNLPLSDSRSCQYALTGVVIHVGGSASSGHYTAYIKKPGRKGKDQWFHVDDSFVEAVPEKTVLRQRDAYLLFYCRKEVKLEFPSPPPQGMSAAEAMKVMRARAKARSDSFSKESPSEINSMKEKESKKIKSATSPVARAPSVVSKGIMDESDSDSYDSDFDPTKVADSSDSDSADVDQEMHDIISEGTTTIMKRTKTTTHPLSSPLLMKKDKKSSISESQALFDMSRPNDNVNERDSDSSDSEFDPQAQSSDEESDSDSSTVENESPTKGLGSSRPSASSESDDSSSGGSASSSSGDSSSDDESSSSDDSSSDDDDSEDSSSVTESSSKMKVQPANRRADAVKLPESSSDDESSSDESDSKQSSSSSDSEEPNVQEELKKKASQSSPIKNTSTAKPSVESSPSAEKATSKRTRVVLDRKDARGKIQVMMGPKKKKHWQSKVTTVGAKGDGFDLLGNLSVSKWDDEDDTPVGDSQATSKSPTSSERQQIIKKINKNEKSRKRKHHLDRWDAHLDQGRMKKTKEDKANNQASMFGQFPKNNVFQKIQSSVSRMKRGKPKGFFQGKGRVTSTAAGHRKRH
mmetsp:Transcript_36148/g.87407  ORF Transcript_36148/g.87407 Transcript_36148/m.87407 type:complete len:1127 (-) Transcript_36148:2632-6012(-)